MSGLGVDQSGSTLTVVGSSPSSGAQAWAFSNDRVERYEKLAACYGF